MNSIIQALWPREGGYTNEEEVLLATLIDGHRKAAINNNCVSSAALRNASVGGADPSVCYIAAMATIGRVHAPVTAARYILFNEDRDLWIKVLDSGAKLPGFGNDFFKSDIDPAFEPAFDLLPLETRDRLIGMSAAILHRKKKIIYPNAASITAAVAHTLNLPAGAELLILLMGRGAGWNTIIQ